MALRLGRIATALALISVIGGTAQAQTSRLHLGPRLSYQFDLEKFGLGAQLGVPVVRHLEFYPSFDYFFVSRGSYLALNADLKYRLPSESVNWLYFGGGLSVTRSGGGGVNRTHAGVNFLAGAESLHGRVHPFAELRVTANDGSTAQISAGLNFTLGQH